MPGVLYDLQGYLLLRRAVCTPFAGKLHDRGEIRGFSPSSGARMRRYLRSCSSAYAVMGTLTYPFSYPTDGRTCKGHLDTLVKAIRRYVSQDATVQEEFSLFWFLEFQQRGAPHFHFFCTHHIDKDWLARRWYEVVGSEDVRHLQAGTRIEAIRSGRYGTCAYAGKYAAKQDQKDVPPNFAHVGRFWGVYGCRRCLAASIFFPVDLLENPIYSEFRSELRNILRKARAAIRNLKLKGVSSGVHIGNLKVIEEIKLLFCRYAVKLMALGEFNLFEAPLLDTPMEDSP